jgi:sialic acid synthase SpsE
VAAAVGVARAAGNHQVAVLHCVSSYPTPPQCENLRAIRTMSQTFRVPVGLSDHGGGLPSATAAVALGASLYERHIMLPDDDAIDEAVSSTPSELLEIVRAMEHVRQALGSGIKEIQRSEAPNVVPSRRGLYASRALRAGDRITHTDVAVLRPANALAPRDIEALVGMTLMRDIAAGEAFEANDVKQGRAA